MPVKPDDNSLAGAVSNAVMKSKAPEFDPARQGAMQGMREEEEGKMGYPPNIRPKRERDLRRSDIGVVGG